MRRAFTLIELLVVIAIIAILAAILFPVFAQAKVAAKKTASLSNVKQLNTGTQIYLSDSDDVFPTAYGATVTGGVVTWKWNTFHAVPADWTTYNNVKSFSVGAWQNCIQPYVKNGGIYESPAGTDLLIGSYANSALPANKVKDPYKTGYGYNGLLHAYNASGVQSPATVPLATQSGGKDNVVGFDTGPFPAMYCGNPGEVCVYTNASNGACGANGTYDYFFYGYNSQWVYGQVQTWTYTDGHAGIRRLGFQYGTGTYTDYRQDPFANYLKPDGRASDLAWYDQYYCHALIFRPDWDGSTLTGAPYAGY